MYNLFLSKVAVQPLSQSCPTLSRDPDARCGNTWVSNALLSNPGICNDAVCVEVIVALFGNRTQIPWGVFWIFVRGRVQWIRSECCRK